VRGFFSYMFLFTLLNCFRGGAIYNVSEFVFPFFLELEARFWG
jgi:hypothetical protein